jgi:nicotinate-nucleotide adenylyltransferase
MRIGIFGGSFDPVHLAHLIHAEACHEQARLNRLLFVPAARPPHKQSGTQAPFADRAAMLRLAIADHDGWEVEECERDRPGPNYTVDTLQELRTREPDAQFLLIVGSDSVHDIATWRAPETIARLASLLVVQRPQSKDAKPPDYFQFQAVRSPLLEISSTALRNRVKQGESIRYLVPDAVRDYLFEKGLYRAPVPEVKQR